MKQVFEINFMLVIIIMPLVSMIVFNKQLYAKPGLSMIFFPEGEFWMGSNEDIGRDDEHPKHKVFLNDFYLDQFEVTGKAFEKYLEINKDEYPTVIGWFDRKVRPGMEKKPVIGLSWERCFKFCRWKGKRLPTEAEWERAASGVEGRIYPWGNEAPDNVRSNFNKCCFINRGKVLDNIGSYDAGRTPEGVYDLAGNIAEWVYDWYSKTYYGKSKYKNPEGPNNGTYHVIRGGAWNSFGGYLRAKSRYGYNDAKDFYGIGCRCAKSKY